MADITLDDEIACIAREVALRRHLYPKWIESGKMPPVKAAHEIATMDQVLTRLRELRHAEDQTQPDMFGETAL